MTRQLRSDYVGQGLDLHQTATDYFSEAIAFSERIGKTWVNF
jgi:hypothetical protein